MSTSQAPPSSIAAFLDDCIFAIRKRVSIEPVVGVVLGSGLGAFADRLDDLVKIPYRDLPHMPASAVQGHAGNLCFGRVDGVPVVCMQGRVHLYEGHPVGKVVQGVRTMARMGVKCVLLTNAAGGLEPSWSAGDLMVVTDHLNLTGTTPLLGPNDDALGPRFPDMTAAYDVELRAALKAVARDARIELREGVYAGRGSHGEGAGSPGGRHEHGARGTRATAHGGAGGRAFVHHQPGGRHLAPPAR